MRRVAAAQRQSATVQKDAADYGDAAGAGQFAFGNTIKNLGSVFVALGEQRQEAADAAFLSNASLELTRQYSEVEAQAPSRALEDGFVDSIDRDMSEIQGKTLEALTGKEGRFRPSLQARERYEQLSMGMRTDTARRAIALAHNEQVSQLYDLSQDNIMAAAKRVAITGDLEGTKALIKQEAANIARILSPSKVREFERNAANTLEDAAKLSIKGENAAAAALRKGNEMAVSAGVRGFLLRNDPVGAQKMLDGEIGKISETSSDLQKVIFASANTEGVDPALLLALGMVESRLKLNAKSKTSSAAGVFQITKETAGLVGLPSDVRDATIEEQSAGAAKLTASNTKILKKKINGDPTPGEVYLAHFLGVGRAGALINADPETPVSDLLPADVIKANKKVLKGKQAWQVQAWAQEKMQKALTDIGSGGVINGRFFANNEAGLPINTLHGLQKDINDFQLAKAKEAEKIIKEIGDARTGEHKDVGGLVMKTDPDVQTSFMDFQTGLTDEESEPSDIARLGSVAIAKSLNAQDALGIPKRLQKALPKQMVMQINANITGAADPDERTQNFLQWKANFGVDWDETVMPELVEAGLPAGYEFMSVVSDSASDIAQVSNVISLDEKEMIDGLGIAGRDFKNHNLPEIEDGLADFFSALETGPFDRETAIAKSNSMIEILRKVALDHYRINRDGSAAVKHATDMIEDRFEIVSGPKMNVVLDRSLGVFPRDLDISTAKMQTRERLEAFDPEPIGRPGTPGFLEKETTLRTAVNSGLWVTNETGDGVMLVLPFQNQSGFATVMNADGEPYEIKFKDVERGQVSPDPALIPDRPVTMFTDPEGLLR